jgi:hypothetical protein
MRSFHIDKNQKNVLICFNVIDKQNRVALIKGFYFFLFTMNIKSYDLMKPCNSSISTSTFPQLLFFLKLSYYSNNDRAVLYLHFENDRSAFRKSKLFLRMTITLLPILATQITQSAFGPSQITSAITARLTVPSIDQLFVLGIVPAPNVPHGHERG